MQKLIVISSSVFIHNEVEKFTALFDAGLEYLHLRKPNTSIDEIENIIRQIPSSYHKNIVLHDCFQLADKYRIGGINLNQRNNSVPLGFQGNVSRSCHSLHELNDKDNFNYLLLSPIFNSISKSGYFTTFTLNELEQASRDNLINEKVIALGGIDHTNLSQIKALSFGGVALLGAIWGKENEIVDTRETVKRFEAIRKEITT